MEIFERSDSTTSCRFDSLGFDSEPEIANVFDITRTKHCWVAKLKRWRQAALVLNASRRFQYTLDLRSENEKKATLLKIREHARVIRAAFLFKQEPRISASKKRIQANAQSSGEWYTPSQSGQPSGQAGGHWYTGPGGRKVYVSKTGQELTGQTAYRLYSKESGKRAVKAGKGKAKK